MCMVEDSPGAFVSPLATAPARVTPEAEDGLSILPPSMRRNFLASLNRNKEAFAELAKL
jgi:hypothetical protein